MDKITGVLLVNVGSPDAPTTKAVRKYLFQFLTDKRIIELSPILWRPILHGLILRTRPGRSAKAYEKIWRKDINGQYSKQSMLVELTCEQAVKLEKIMPENYRVEAAMRYGNPSVESGLKKLKQFGCEEILILPLYPQFSKTTTQSVYDAVSLVEKKLGTLPRLKFSRNYYKNPDYISAITNRLTKHLNDLNWQADKILVSFHGLPKSSIEKGDPYENECEEIFNLIKVKLPELADKFILSYQSRFGPKEWLSPYTASVLKNAAQTGNKNIVIITPGFAADRLETMEELAINVKEKFLEEGGKNLSVVPCLNADRAHIKLLANIVHNLHSTNR